MNVAEHIRNKLKGLPTGALDKVLRYSFSAKTSLNALLGHNEENDYRTLIPIDITEDDWIESDWRYPTLKKVLEAVFPNGTITCLKNEYIPHGGKQAKKLTRIILEELKKDPSPSHPLREFLENSFYWSENQYGQRLGELFCPKGDRVIVLTTNPFDFLTASGQYWDLAAFSSCHNFDGCHFNGNLSYMNDDFTAMFYVANPDNIDYKIGRSWVFIKDGSLLQPKSYGTFNNTQRKVAREYLENLISTGRWKVRNMEYYNGDLGGGSNYLDTDDMAFAFQVSLHGEDPDKASPPQLEFSEARCLECGCPTDSEEDGTCYDCGGSRVTCICCNECLDPEYAYTDSDGDYYCSECYNDTYTECHHCGCEIHMESDNLRTGADDEYYCPRCFNRFFYMCEDCDEVFPIDEAVNCDGDSVCPSCAKDRGFYECDHCGDMSDDLTTVQDSGECLCPDCLDHKATQCEDCGHYFATTEEINGDEYCLACAPAHAEEEELEAAA